MKNYTIAALAAIPGIVAVAPAATLEDYAAIIDQQLNSVKELVTILSAVNDKATADEAAAKIDIIVKNSQEAEAKAAALGAPSQEILAKLEKIFNGRQKEISAAFNQLVPIMGELQTKNFHGSKKLKTALESFGGNNGGAAPAKAAK